jgi:hypothetical protein
MYLDVNPAFLLAEPAGFVAGAAVLYRRPAFMDGPLVVPVVALAAASAAGALAAGGSATGWTPLDALLLAGLGAGAVVVGTLARTRLVMVAAIVAAVAGLGSSAFPLALAATGVLLASFLLDPDPLVDAAASGLVVQAALRLNHPVGRGQTALVAAGVLLLIGASALAQASRRRRRTVLRVVVGAGAFAVVGAVVGGVAAWGSVRPLRRGLASVSSLGAPRADGDVATTSTRLADAQRDFTTARRALDAWWVRPAAAVPLVAQHWRVLHAAAVTGDDLAAEGRRALDAPALSDIRVVDGQIPLDQLAAIGGPVQRLAEQLTAGRRRLSDSRSPWLLPPLRDKLDTQLVRVDGLERTTRSVSRAMPLLPGLLGGDGPRRYFLAVLSPVELRAGGGFLGNFGEITADHGRLALTRFGRPIELNKAGGDQRHLVAPPDFTARYSRFGPAIDWANINLSPDFPSDAQVIEGLYPQSGGAPIDGVIAVDPSVLAALLRVLGPVKVASWPTPITADNALQIMLYDQYLRYGNADRIDFLGDAAQETWRRLTSGALPAPPQLLGALGPSVRTKDLFMWSNHPEEQKLFEDIGVAGNIAPVRGDFVGLVTQNASGNKIDYFLRRSVDYRVRLDPRTGKVDATATITLHNGAPASGLPPTIIGNELVPPLPDGQNRLYLSFYTPWALAGARLDGTPVALDDERELGRKVYSTAIVVPPQGDATLELRLTGRLAKVGGDYHLDVYRQPTIAPDELTTALSVPGAWRVPGGGRTSTTDRHLDADATVDVALDRP